MKKIIKIDNKKYYVKTEIDKKGNYISIWGGYDTPDVNVASYYYTIFESTRLKFSLLNYFGYGLQERVEKDIQKAIKAIQKYHYKENELQIIDSKIGEIFNLDEKMNL